MTGLRNQPAYQMTSEKYCESQHSVKSSDHLGGKLGFGQRSMWAYLKVSRGSGSV